MGDGIGAAGVVLHPGSTRGRAAAGGAAAGRRGAAATRSTSRSAARCCSRTRPARATRSGARFEELARADRPRRRPTSGSGSASTPATCSPAGFDIRTADKLTRGDRRLRRPSASAACAACTSTTRRPRWARTATATPRSATASSARAAAPRSCPSRASRGCPRSSRAPGGPARRRKEDIDRAASCGATACARASGAADAHYHPRGGDALSFQTTSANTRSGCCAGTCSAAV